MIVGIQPDDYGPTDSSSPLWSEFLRKAGFTVREVNVYRADILSQLTNCDGFMWRHGHRPQHRQIARRLLPILERELEMVVYPDQNTCWHYDDKIAQAYLFQALGIPHPRTWVWFEEAAVTDWAKDATYPLVFKLWAGAGSTNVRKVVTAADAITLIEQMFDCGMPGGGEQTPNPWSSMRQRLWSAAKLVIRGLPPPSPPPDAVFWELHKDYVLFQEFIPNNNYDTRVTVIGNRAFGFRRFNKPNDFRASGSGLLDFDPSGIDQKFIRLAFSTARKLQSVSCAIDGLWRRDEPVVGEVSYTYASWAVEKCPGHWELDGDPETGKLRWVEGHMWPEEAQAADFIVKLAMRGP